MDATERERLAALAEHRDDMTDREGERCSWTGEPHRFGGRGNECHDCDIPRYTNEGRRGAYMHAAAEAVPALLAALAEAEAEVQRLRSESAWRDEHGDLVAEAADGLTRDLTTVQRLYEEACAEERKNAAERDRYRSQVEAVRALHRDEGSACGHCGVYNEDDDVVPEPYPCATVRALDGAES